MKKKVSILGISVLAFALIFFVVPQVKADATITQAATSDVSSDSYDTGDSVALPYILITEGVAGDIAIGSHVWTIPEGYVFDTAASAPDVVYSDTSLAGDSTATMDSTTMTITTSAASTAVGTMKIGGTTPIKVKVSAGCPMASAGNIKMTGGTITGLDGTSIISGP